MKKLFFWTMFSLLIGGCTEKDENTHNDDFHGRFSSYDDYFVKSGSDSYVRSSHWMTHALFTDGGDCSSAPDAAIYSGRYDFSSSGYWQITGGESWCTISPTEGNTQSGSMKISFITQNNNKEDRSAEFQITHNGRTHQFKITQLGYNRQDIHVETPGTLPLLIEKTDYGPMNVSGELNSTDYEFIKSMPNLRALRMSDVICTKPLYLDLDGSLISCLILPNELKDISKLCTPLVRNIYIPASVETIGDFTSNKYLTHVIFEPGSQLKTIKKAAFQYLKELYEIDMSACTQLELIDGDVFWPDENLRTVKIGAKEPPKVYWNTFSGIHSYAELYVPAESINAYKEAGWWKYFRTIEALE